MQILFLLFEPLVNIVNVICLIVFVVNKQIIICKRLLLNLAAVINVVLQENLMHECSVVLCVKHLILH